METMPWYQSAIVRQQIVQFVAALTGLFGLNLGGLDLDQTVANVFLGIAAGIAIWTTITRIFKPAPNLTQTAAAKEVQLVKDEKIPPSPTGPQRGFASMKMLAVIGMATAVLGLFAGCAGTPSAYKTAKSSPAALVDTATVVAEHYSAIQAEVLRVNATTGIPSDAKAVIKQADTAARQLVIGDPMSGQPGLLKLVANYKAVRDAKTEADLSAAIARASTAVANLINALKTSRR